MSLLLGGAVVAGVVVTTRGSSAAVSYSGSIQPIFDRSCVSCHPTSYPYLDLRAGRSYQSLVGVPAYTDPAFDRVLQGRPDLSFLLTHPVDPSNATLLSGADRALIRAWIAEGAPNN